MMLSGEEIKARLNKDIIISPFNEKQLNPNSYNLTLHNELLVYDTGILDTKIKLPTKNIIIPDDGFVLQPGILYLGKTVEYTETYNLVPQLEGRSSMGRLGISVHATAGFGDIGFCGSWTLNLFTVQPVKVYPNMKVCQIFYFNIIGRYKNYTGKYNNTSQIKPSQSYKEANK